MKWFVALLVLVPVYLFAEIKVANGKITADIYSQTLGEVVDKLELDGNIRFSMEEGLANQTVSASFKELPVAVAIKKLLEGTGINYAVVSIGNEPPVIFIGKREAPGAARRILDTRPVNRQPRGVVTPVNPSYPPPPPPQGAIPIEKQGVNPVPPQNQKPSANPNPGVNIPTGGGYVPGTQQQETGQPNEDDQTSESEEPEEEEQ
jgi:hypothetical protein